LFLRTVLCLKVPRFHPLVLVIRSETWKLFVLYLKSLLAARSKAWVCGRSLVGIVCSNLAGVWDVCCECCELSGRRVCVGLITRPEESYRLCCALFCVNTYKNNPSLPAIIR
jgi:hypothetical protein